MPGLQQLALPNLPYSSPSSYARRSPSPLALPSPCRSEPSMAQFTNPYASMQVPLYTNVDRKEAEDLIALNHRSFQQMGRQLSMDGLEVQLRAKDSIEKASLAPNRFLNALPHT